LKSYWKSVEKAGFNISNVRNIEPYEIDAR